MIETVPKHAESIMLQLLLVILSIYFFFSNFEKFPFKGNFAKKVLFIEVIDMLCNVKVECDFLLQKIFPFFSIQEHFLWAFSE